MKVLFITGDGITDHITKSQVIPYMLGLSRKEHDITILTAEKDVYSEEVEEYVSFFNKSNITWRFISHSNKIPIFSHFLTYSSQYREAKKICLEDKMDLIHARCYTGAILGYFLKRSIGNNLKLLFDLRDFWLDTRIETQRPRFIYRILKLLEGYIFRDTDHFICLTEKAKIRIKSMCKGFGCSSEIKVIPCCADLELFNYENVDSLDVQRVREKNKLDDCFVLTYLGSIGPDYLLDKMVKTFKILKTLKNNSKFLFIANNGKKEIIKEFVNQKVPVEDLVFKTVHRNEVPKYLMLSDFSLVFIRQSQSKIGCSPTKLAELLGMGIPILSNVGFGDVEEILSPRSNNSICLESFKFEDIKSSLVELLNSEVDKKLIRKFALMNFSLEEAIKRYVEVYEDLEVLRKSASLAT